MGRGVGGWGWGAGGVATNVPRPQANWNPFTLEPSRNSIQHLPVCSLRFSILRLIFLCCVCNTRESIFQDDICILKNQM